MYLWKKDLRAEIERLRISLSVASSQKTYYKEHCAQLSDKLKQSERDALEAIEKLKRQEHENGLLREQMEPLSCEGCIHAENYRKCTSCARYPKIKDKYETEG